MDDKNITISAPEEISLFDNPSIAKSRGFALARYSKDMTLLQRRMLAVALSQIKATDSADQSYNVNIRELASILELNKQTLSRNITLAAKTMLDNNQTVYFETENGWISSVLIDSVERKDSYNFEIKFGSKLMPILLEMKKKYDIIYPIKNTLSFKSKYSHLLYDFLLAKATCIEKPKDGIYVVEVKPKDLLEVLGMKTKNVKNVMGRFNSKAIAPAVKDLNEFSEINILNDGPEILRDRTGIIGYIFRFTIKNDEMSLAIAKEQFQLFTNIYSPSDLPPWEMLVDEMKKIGVSDSLIKRIEFEDKVLRTWKNLAYTKLYGESNPRYFNKAYNEDYASSYAIEDLLNELDKSKSKKAREKKQEEYYRENSTPLFPVDVEPEPLKESELKEGFFKRKYEEMKKRKEEEK